MRDTLRCPHCDAVWTADSLFCASCSKPLVPCTTWGDRIEGALVFVGFFAVIFAAFYAIYQFLEAMWQLALLRHP